VLNNSTADRFSMPLFFGPNYETVIEPLNCCLEDEESVSAPFCRHRVGCFD
jgi:isopenicillin N synthase-like dioxygenase